MNLEGIEGVGEDSKSPIIRPGRYVVELETAAAGKSRKTRKDYILNEVKVLEARGEDASKVGSTVAFFINEDVMYNKHIKQIASYVRALVREPGTTVTQQMVANLVSPGNPLKGTKFEIEAKPVLDKVTGKAKTFATGDVILDFSFAPYTENTTATMPPTTGTTTSTKAARK